MSKTTAELAEAVLRELGVIDAGEDPDTDDATYVTDTYRSKWEELSSHGNELTYWSYDAIPEPVFLIMRDLVMLEVMGAFGQPMPPADKDAREQVILRRLRRHTTVQSSGRSTAVDFF